MRYPLEIVSDVDTLRLTHAETLNVNTSGLYAVTVDRDTLLTLGMRVLLRIHRSTAPQQAPDELPGTVIRVESLNEGGRELRGVAIKFAESQPRYA